MTHRASEYLTSKKEQDRHSSLVQKKCPRQPTLSAKIDRFPIFFLDRVIVRGHTDLMLNPYTIDGATVLATSYAEAKRIAKEERELFWVKVATSKKG